MRGREAMASGVECRCDVKVREFWFETVINDLLNLNKKWRESFKVEKIYENFLNIFFIVF
jgi:hypothetical protein